MDWIKKILHLVVTNKTFVEDADYYTFCLSLLPIPIIQQIGQVLNRIVSSQSLRLESEKLKEEIYAEIGIEKLKSIHDDLGRIKEIATSVDKNENLKERIKYFLEKVLKESEFIIDTKNWSIQKIIDSIIEADYVVISAGENSTNFVNGVNINAPKTHFIATNNSQNIIENGNFSSGRGSIGMRGIVQQGHISVTGNSIGFGNRGGKIIFRERRPTK